jgi:hypothetical protein
MLNKNAKSKKPAKFNKQTKQSFYSNKTFIVVASFLLLILLLFFLRGWFRATVIPKTSSLFYINSVQNTLASENTDLQYPFNQLGLTSSPSKSTCNLEVAQSISTEIDCGVSIQSYAKLPSNKSGQTSIEAKAQSIQNLLSSMGWKGGSNGVTLTSLIDGTYQGKDYSPDAYYEKVIGNDDCVFDTMIAYANPQPPAISSTLSCDRTVNILGTPNGEFYVSSKGHY